MKTQIISQGAEAIIIKENNQVIKKRIKKSYRISELDKKINKQRTRAEIKLLTKASSIINCPIPEIPKNKNSTDFKIPFIEGKKLSEHLDSFPLKKQKSILNQIGKDIAKLHAENIIHGDLTTSNMIFFKDKTYLIDFGLGYFNGKYEDKAVDIHLLKQALEAKHFKNWKILFEGLLKGYKNSKNYEKVIQKLKAVEKRGRYKH
jgi:TP53 regulating kinase and related kinases